MNKIKLALCAVALVAVCNVSFGQAQNVSEFKPGTTLSAADLGFLNLVANTQVSASRGPGEKLTATVNGVKYTEGQTLSASDVTALQAAVDNFAKNNKGKKKMKNKTVDASRGASCCYWYYYCYGGYCRYWWYCYC